MTCCADAGAAMSSVTNSRLFMEAIPFDVETVHVNVNVNVNVNVRSIRYDPGEKLDGCLGLSRGRLRLFQKRFPQPVHDLQRVFKVAG